MEEIYQVIQKLIKRNSPGCIAVKTYLASLKRNCEFPFNWCDFVSIAVMFVFLDKSEHCCVVRFTNNGSLGSHFCIKKDNLYSDFTINQFPNYEEPIIKSLVHPFSKEWDNEKMLEESEVIKLLQIWPKDVNHVIKKFTDDLKEAMIA